MLITRENIAAAIYDLIGAGKRIPEQPSLDGKVKSAAETMKNTVELWWGLFGERQIGVERWQEATKIAMTTTGSGMMLNVNMVTPGLMDYALQQAEKNYLANQQTKAQAEKKQEVSFKGSDYHTRCNDYLWKWTIKKLAAKSSIMDNMPSDDAVMKYAKTHGIKCEYPEGNNTDAGCNFRMIQTYLADVHCCRTGCNPSKCYMAKMQPTLYVKDGNVSFELVACQG